MEDNSRKRLYDKLSESFNLGTFEEFDSKMGNDSSRRALYDKVTEKYDIGTFEEFNAKMGNTHKQNLDAFNSQYGSFMNDFESRDTAETKMSRAGMSSGLVVPTEGSISGEERQKYLELHKQEEALKRAWYNSPDYLAQKDADALLLSQVRDSIDQGRLEFAQANPMIEGYNPSATRGAEADKELQMYETASRIMHDAIKLHNAPSKYDGKNAFVKFGKGSVDTLSDLDFWTAGLTEITDNFGVRDVLNSVQSKLGNLNDLSEEAIEDILSPAEKAVLQAWAINAQEQVNRKDDLARAYQAGQSATESLGFMAEFALTGGVGKATSEGVEAMAKWLGRKVLGSMDEAAAATVREMGEKIAKSTVGKYGARLADALSETAGKTLVMPSTFRNISEKAAEIQEDAEGNRYLTRMNDAFAKGFTDSFIENLSEGGRVNAIGDLIGDVAGKIPAYKKIVDKFANSKAGELLTAFNSSGIMNTLRAGGWHGFGEEYLEEWYGNALRTITGLDKDALKDFATVDNQLITITSFLPMTIFGGTISTAQVLSAKKGLDKKAEMLRSALLERGYDEKQADNMIDMMRGASPAEISQTLTPIINAVALRDLNEAAALMKPVGEFAEAVRRWQSFDTKYQYQEQEQRDNLRTQMEETLGQFWQEDENGRQTVQRGVNANGEVVYLLGKPSAADAQSGTPQQVAAITSDGRKVFVDPSAVRIEGELEMNDFLGNEIMAEKGNKEQARMVEERERALAQVRQMSAPGTTVNLGTTEAPVVGTVTQRTPDGVVITMQDGTARQVSYEELGNYVGVNTTPLTDAQMDERDADALSADRAQREAELDMEYENLGSSENELTEAEAEVEQAVEAATPLPTKADGSVDQTALWNTDPARWAQWNDEQRQDGGTHTASFLLKNIQKLRNDIMALNAEREANLDPEAEAQYDARIDAARDRMASLINVFEKYVPSDIAQQMILGEQTMPTQTGTAPATASEQVSPRVTSRMSEQEKAQIDNIYERKLRLAADQSERVSIITEYVGKISEGSMPAVVITRANYKEAMRAAKCSEALIGRVETVLNAGQNVGAFIANGHIFIMEEGTTSIEEVRKSYVHERQHAYNTAHPELVQAVVDAVKGDKNTLLAWLLTFMNEKAIETYKDDNVFRLADELIARCMEIAYTTEEFSVDLRSRGISPEVISIIKKIDNEQRLTQGYLNARRGSGRTSYDNVPGYSNMSENGRDSRQVSGGILEQQETRPSANGDGRTQFGESREGAEPGEVISETPKEDPVDSNGVTAEQNEEINRSVGGELEVGDENTPVRFSVTAIGHGAGLELLKDDGEGNVALVLPDGRKFNAKHLLKPEDLKSLPDSVLSYMMSDARALGNIDARKEWMLWNKYTLMLNAILSKGSAENGGFEHLASQWQWIADTVYKTVATNSDTQYSYSLDITRVCKKNEAVINAIAEMQARLGYGITPGQIMDIYMSTIEEGYQVPCPVCYVFSRYIRNGKYATIMINGQRKYGSKLVDPRTLSEEEKEKLIKYWLKEKERIEAQNEANKGEIEKANADITTLLDEIDKLSKKITDPRSNLTEEQKEKILKKIHELDARYKAALNVVSQSSLDSWITQFAIYKKKEDGKERWVLYEDSYMGFPEEMALDLRQTSTVMRLYPAIQRFRKSRGAAAGKEITFVSNNDLGDVALALGSKGATEDLATPRDMSDKEWEELQKRENGALMAGQKNLYQQAYEEKDASKKAALLKKARERFASASEYAKRQSLRGGQRMWSWSDNIERLAPDVFVNLFQMELLGGALQSYSKQLEGIKLVASMNGYVNGSLMGKGNGYAEVSEEDVEEVDGKFFLKGGDFVMTLKNGKKSTLRTPVYKHTDGKFYVLEFDDVVGIDAFGKDIDGKHYKGLFELNAEYDKAGNILVGMNDLHIRIAMADDRIFFIIPWHSSGANTHILAQMYDYLGVEYDVTLSQDYTDVQSEKRIKGPGEKEESSKKDKKGKEKKESTPVSTFLAEFWNDHYENAREYVGYGMVAGKDFACGIEGGIASSDGKGNLSEDQMHYRELRDAIFMGVKVQTGTDKKGKPVYKNVNVEEYSEEWFNEIMNDEFLSQVYARVRESMGEEGRMASQDTKSIYPYEYWDESSTYETSSINGARYMEYCRRLGYKPKFCGKLDGKAETDFGNFTEDAGYWKTLIDRRMYAVDGSFQGLTPVTAENFTPDLVDPEVTKEEFVVTRVADEAGTQTIVDKAIAKEESRPGGIAKVDYDMTLSEALDEYNGGDVRMRVSAPSGAIDLVEEARKADLRHRVTAEGTLVPGHKKGESMVPKYESFDTLSFRITKNTKATIEGWCDKAGIDEELKEDFVTHLEYTFDDSTEQLCAAKWYLNGSINLPNEDEQKVRDAVKVAKQHKVDAFSYSSPMEILNTYGKPKGKQKPINPDTVPTLTNKVEVPGTDITLYDVDESEESRKNMREIINTHYGKDASPWCLLQGDEDGNLIEHSESYWKYYSATKKRVAFLKGRLLAFSATTGSVTWWDRNDIPHDNIPVVKPMEEDALKRKRQYEYSENGDLVLEGNMFKGNKRDGKYIEWEVSPNYGAHISRIENRKNGKPEGLWQGFYSDGSPCIANFYEKGVQVSAIQFGDNQSWASFIGGPNHKIKVQVYFSKQENNVVAITDYTNGKGLKLIGKDYFEGALAQEPKYKALAEYYANLFDRSKPGLGLTPEDAETTLDIVLGWIDQEQKKSEVSFRITAEQDKAYMDAVKAGDMETAQRMVDEAAAAAGYTIRGDHGRVSKFSIFDRNKANPEGNWGQGFYFSNNEEDVENNYATVDGPDLEAKIEREVERRVNLAEMNEEFNEDGEVDEFAIREAVEDEFITSEPNVVHAAIKMDNPFVVGHGMVEIGEDGLGRYDMQETYLTAEYETDEDGEADYSIDPTGTLVDLVEALNDELSEYEGVNINAYDILSDNIDGMTASQFEKEARELLENSADYLLNDDLAIMTSEIIRAAIERAGFDGIVDNTVNQKFGTARRFGRAMEGMDENTRHYIAFQSNQIKETDPVTYDNNGNVIPLSQRFNPENEDIRFSIRSEEQREKLFDDAKAKYGVTKNFNAAGYMLPDGSLLDFSEANDGGDPNSRSLDHRDIEGIIMDNGVEYDSRWMYIADFMNEGAIRLLPESAGINMIQAPTEEQRKKIFDFIYKYNGEVILEINDERLNSIAYMEYDRRTSPSRIFRDIDGYFNDGIVPQQDVRFRVVDTTKAELKDKPIKMNGMYRFKLKSAFKGIKDSSGQFGYVTTQIHVGNETMEDPYRVRFDGSLEGYAVIYVRPDLAKITEDKEKEHTFYIDPTPIKDALWEALKAAENYYEAKYAQGPWAKFKNPGPFGYFDWQNADKDSESSIRFRMSNENQAIFVSNAAKAVEGIKQEKATPEQWLKMLEKAGGLKAGEDKWMGLSDWLKASDKKTLTKAEVLDFINENMIVIEEQHYSNQLAYENNSRLMDEKYPGWRDAFSFEWDDYRDAPNADILDAEGAATLYNKYNEDKVEVDEDGEIVSEQDRNKVILWGEDIAKVFFGQEGDAVRPIHDTREVYTTKGLINRHEIALTVPTIESWGKSDMIHFGDAGDGRAIAWIRFGETSYKTVSEDSAAYNESIDALYAYWDYLREKYGNGWADAMTEAEKAEEKRIQDKYKIKRANLRKKVLVIDEIQSKRHQEGREKGYKTKEAEQSYGKVLDDLAQKEKALLSYIDELVEKYPGVPRHIDRIFVHKEQFTREEVYKLYELRDDYGTQYNIAFDKNNSYYKLIPDAPFDKNWHELAMKRMLRYAAENGYDVIAWTKGEQQAERYDLSKQINSISRKDSEGFTGRRFVLRGPEAHIRFVVNDEGIVTYASNSNDGDKPLSDYVGKELAVKMMTLNNGDSLGETEIAIGGEGMKGFYDKMLPAFMNKYGKKWGVKVEDIDLPKLEDGLTMHSVPVTEEMKASVMEGQVMFRMRGENESARDFVQSVTSEMQYAYPSIPTINVEDVTPEVAKKYGYTFDELKETSGLYLVDDKLIIIFAHEDIENEYQVKGSVYHESTHWVIKTSKLSTRIGKFFWDNADRTEFFKELKDFISETYDEKDWHEEMMCFVLSGVMVDGAINETKVALPQDLRDDFSIILNNIGYGRERKRSRITWKNTPAKDGGKSTTEKGMGLETDKGQWNIEKGLTAEERRIIREYFPTFGESDVRMRVNSHGKDLTEGQQEFFANSKAVDKDGNLLVLYHGTPRAGFTEFKSGFFTTSKEDAISYSGDRKGRLFDPNEKYEPETLTAGDFRLGYMTFDSEADRAAFLERFPYAEDVMSEREYEETRMGAEDDEYDALTARRKEFAEVWNAYREYERERFVDTTIGDLLANPEAYTEEDLMRAMMEYDSNASFDNLDDMSAEERRDALVSALQNANEETEGGILDMVVPTRVPRNGEGQKHNDLGNRTYEVYANVENPYEIDANGRGSEFESGDVYRAIEEGLANEEYDGVIVRNWRTGRHQQLGDVVIPKNGSQIKLTSNENPTESSDIQFRITESGEGDIRFSIRTKPAPKRVETAYKLFNVDENGNPHALFIDGANALGMEVWYDADSPLVKDLEKLEPGFTYLVDKDGNAEQKQYKNKQKSPSKAEVEEATANGSRYILVGQYANGKKSYHNWGINGSGQVSKFAMRPGWHLTDSPSARHIGEERNPAKKEEAMYRRPNQRWFKVEYAADVDYNEEAASNPTKDIQTHIPEDGYYSFKTNTNANDVNQNWIISGSIRIVKPLSREEVRRLNEENGVPDDLDYKDEVSFRITGTPTEDVVAEGVSLSPAQLASLAGDIFAALPEDVRKKITDGLNGNILGLQDAILQIPTSLATKEEWNDEDRQIAEVVAEQMTKAVGKEMTRPFSTNEALWTLYNAVNKPTDLVSEASRALVRRNLGFDSQTLEKEKAAEDGVRFRTVGNASANAQASMYNRGAANVWTRLKESFVDMHASVEKLVKAIEKASGKVAEGFENVLMALNQQSSKGLAAMEAYEQKFLNKMFDEIRAIMDKTDFKYEDIVRYVILKHGLERNEKMAQRDAREFYRAEFEQKVASINADQSLTDAQKQALIAAAQQELDSHLTDIDWKIDAKFMEFREKDYSGISSMFYDTLGVSRKDYATEEEYQAALMQAKQDKYATLADIEAAAMREVANFETLVNTDNLWDSINKATKEILRQQYEANMISKDQYETLRDMYQFYVPLRGFADNTAEDMYTYYRQPNSSGYTKPILGAEGRKTEAESPFGWIAAMAGSAIASNVKNEAKLALYYFVANRPDNGVATLSRTWYEFSHTDPATGKKVFKPAYPPFTEDLSSDAAKAAYEQWQEDMRQKRAAGLAYESGQRLNLGNAVVNISDTNKPEHIVNVKIGGKDYTIIINGNPRAAQAINGDLNIESSSQDYSSLFGPVLRWMSSVNTSYNPEFWITNMMRDMAFTWMAVNIKEDPAYRRKFKKNYIKAFKVISMVAKNEKGTLGSKYLEQMYQEFVKYGGVTGYTQIKDNETWEKEIENYLKSNAPGSLRNGKIMKGTKRFFHGAHRFGESLEQISRFAAFLTSREMGKSTPEAINDAKEITVNFNRKGSGKMITLEEAKYLTDRNGQPLNKFEQWMAVGLSSIAPLGRRFIMFFNAAIQGLNATYKLWKKNKARSIGWALGYMAVGVINAVVHAMVDDDDDYLDMPQYERRNSLMLGFNGVYVKWALPQEARAFYALGDLAVESIMGRNPHQNVIGEALKISTEILPINPSEGWKAFMPSAAIPAVEILLNEDYKGDPIYNEQKWLSEEERSRTAKWSKAYQGTGKLYVNIAKGLNAVTGGDEHDAGLINLQPEQMEHIVQSAFGGTIRTADKFVSTIMASIDPDEDVTIRQFPFLNRILTLNDERFKNVHVNDVFDYYKADAEHALTLEKQYKKNKDRDALDKLRDSDEYQWAKIYNKYKKPLDKIQEKIKVADGTAERKELMQQQDELKRQMIKEISEL